MHISQKNTGNRHSHFTFLRYTTLALFSLIFITACKKEDNGRQELDLKQIANGFVSPLSVVEPPDGSHRLFVIDQVGKVWIINASGQKLSQPFIDLTGEMVTLNGGYDERGLLSLTFHPDFKRNRKFYVFYTAPPPPGGPTTDAGNTGLPKVWNNTTRIAEFKVSSSNSNMADMGSEKIILEEPHPQGNHNGGTIAFGRDGYLYISIGDGGNKNDIGPGHVEDWYSVNAGGNAQDNEANFMGNVLRIDVNSSGKGLNYAIPKDNPFVEKPGRDEIYAFGFRNPYRFSFDMGGAGRLVLGDAGQNLYEEVDVVEKGGNYGWNVKEGRHCFNAANEKEELSSCPDNDNLGNKLIDPVLEMPNVANPKGGHWVVVVGGNVYRGNSIHGLDGKYIFANFSTSAATPSGELYVSNPTGGSGLWSFEKLSLKSFGDNIGHYIKGFGQDLGGEIYVTATQVLGPTGTSGKIFKLIGEKKEH